MHSWTVRADMSGADRGLRFCSGAWACLVPLFHARHYLEF